MRFFFHYSVDDFSNSYVLSPDTSGDSVLVDPGTFDGNFLSTIEDNGLYIRWVLITRPQKINPRGLRTLKKIYDADIYARSSKVWEFPSSPLRHGQKISLGELHFEVWAFPEFSSDALAFRTENLLFTGDLLSAGHLGKTPNAFGRANLQDSLEKRLFHQEKDYIIFPGEGPPTTLRSEKLFGERVKKTPGLDLEG